MKVSLDANYSGVALRYSERIALATQLSIIPPNSSEYYKISNYGLGGQYDIHSDADMSYKNAGMLL